MKGSDLKARRKVLDIAQNTFADAAGVDVEVIRAIEKNKLKVPQSELKRLKEILESVKSGHNAAA
jgi:predicted transcriptional regulator